MEHLLLSGSNPESGPPLTPAIRAGDFLFISGQGPIDPMTKEIKSGTFEEEAELTLQNVKAVIEGAGATLDRVVKVNVYLKDTGNFAAFNAIYKKYFKPPYPTRTTVGTDLVGISIEIDAIAYVGA